MSTDNEFGSEELQTEVMILRQRVSLKESMIEKMKASLDQQTQSFMTCQKKLGTIELQFNDAENAIRILQDEIQWKDKTIAEIRDEIDRMRNFQFVSDDGNVSVFKYFIAITVAWMIRYILISTILW